MIKGTRNNVVNMLIKDLICADRNIIDCNLWYSEAKKAWIYESIPVIENNLDKIKKNILKSSLGI